MNLSDIRAAASQLPAGATAAPEWIEYLPGGEHTATATVNGKAETLSYTVTVADAAALQADLLRILAAGGPPPFFGFDHVDGRASAWPQEFAWKDGAIKARVTWTPDGEKAVTIKSAGQLPAYRFFSPGFRWDRATGRVVGLCEGECGSLVNNPAFRAISKVAAKHVSAPAEETKTNTMKKEAIADAAIAALGITAEEAAGDNAAALVTARVSALKAETSVKAAQAQSEIASIKARAESAEATVAALQESLANTAIADAIKAKKIAPQDEETKGFWKKALLSDHDAAVKALNKLAPIVGDATKSDTPATPGTPAVEESDEVKARAASIRAAALKLQSQDKSLSWGEAYARAVAAAA